MYIASIHQPNLMPRLKVLQKIALSDVSVSFDTVQYCTREWQNRTRLRGFSNPTSEFWLTAPVAEHASHRTQIDRIQLSNPESIHRRFRRTVLANYSKSRYFSWINRYLEDVLSVSSSRLSDLALRSTKCAFTHLGIDQDFLSCSELNIASQGVGRNRSDRLIEICAAIGADCYLTGSGGLRYIEAGRFFDQGVRLIRQNWTQPSQGKPLDWRDFSFLDYVARFGPELTLQHLVKGETVEIVPAS